MTRLKEAAPLRDQSGKSRLAVGEGRRYRRSHGRRSDRVHTSQVPSKARPFAISDDELTSLGDFNFGYVGRLSPKTWLSMLRGSVCLRGGNG